MFIQMKKNEVRVTIRGRDKELHGYSVEIIDGRLYYYTKPFRCDCGAEYIYKDNQIICPNCGKKSETIYTYEDYHKEQLENLHLRLIGEDEISGLKLYKLNTTLEYDEWCKVEDLFVKLDNEGIKLYGYTNPIIGWVTTEPYRVEEKLNHLIKPENRIEYGAPQYNTRTYLEKKVEKNLNKIHEQFSIADSPEGKFVLEGETIQNPLNPKNMYGGGEWFVITEDSIWMVVNNSRPGDDYNFNNIVTESAGAIGKRVDYNPSLASEIKKLKAYKGGV